VKYAQLGYTRQLEFCDRNRWASYAQEKDKRYSECHVILYRKDRYRAIEKSK